MKFSFKLEGSYQCRNGERLCFGDRALCGQHWHLRVIEFVLRVRKGTLVLVHDV
uniref:Uncharacterized protein n=1 Tax=Anguilla anguilla TaxID=7936 RepID=A0A0E9VWX2_ANGAN